jgi:hypothetical protein
MKSNLTKEFYILIRESKDDELTTWTENFIEKNTCYQIREYLIKYRDAVNKGTFTLSNQEKSDLTRSIDGKCNTGFLGAPDEKDAGFNCCYNEKKKDNLFCGSAKKKTKETLKEKIKSDPKRVAEQMCWFNDNYIHDTVTFCKTQTNPDSPTTNKTEVSTDKKVDSPVNTTTTIQNKVENKPQTPKITDADLKGWDKYPCLKQYPTKKKVTADGEYTYKVIAYLDKSKYYLLDGSVITKYKDGKEEKNYFEC